MNQNSLRIQYDPCGFDSVVARAWVAERALELMAMKDWPEGWTIELRQLVSKLLTDNEWEDVTLPAIYIAAAIHEWEEASHIDYFTGGRL